MQNNKQLSREDVIKLSVSRSAENKISTAQKLSTLYNMPNISLGERKLAEDIFRIMVEDVEISVRQILAECLKKSRNIPNDIVNKLIHDENSVSIPFIKYYEDLKDSDLIGILNAQNIDKQKAVAQRRNLSNDVSAYIVDKCSEDVVITLISNNSANIYEKTYQNILDKYSSSENVKRCLVYRSELPVTVISRLIQHLSEELQKRLILTHNLPADIASDIIEEVKEKATLKVSAEYSSDKQIEELVHELYSSNKLTPSLVVRAICMGDLKFFEYSIVYLSNTPITEVRKILCNTQVDFVIRNLLRKAFIPKNLFPAVFSALKVIKDIRFDMKNSNSQTFSHKVIERILSYSNAEDELDRKDIEYLISKIDWKHRRPSPTAVLQ